VQILDSIEKNGYDNFSRRAYVPKWKKMASLPVAFSKAMLPGLHNPSYASLLATPPSGSGAGSSRAASRQG
jgi:phytoene synthase